MPQVETLRRRFKIGQFVLVGDRGMITSKHIEHLQTLGVDWITALKSPSLRKLIADEAIQPSLFDETNLVEVTHDDFPGERLIACCNPVLGRKRAHKRQDLLAATVKDLEKVQRSVWNGRLSGREKIGLKVGEKLGKHNMAKHVRVTISDGDLAFDIDQDSIEQEARMDGIYVVRTSVSEERMSSADAVRAYKDLAAVERAFRTMKSIDLQVRPIHHRLTDRVKAHLFLCTLAYYVRWHMERAWAAITYKDDDPSEERDPVAPTARSEAATHKAQTGTLPTGEPVHTFKTLLEHLATITRNTCTHPDSGTTFPMTTSPNATQQNALDLLKRISV
jgi:transposase